MLRRVEKIRLCLRRSRRQGRPPAQPAPAAQGNKVLRAAARTALRARMVLGAQQLWRWILNGDTGLFNYFLRCLGIAPVAIFENKTASLVTLIVVMAWRTIGYSMVMILAGLKGVDKGLLEAARVDGANTWQALMRIKLPLIKTPMLLSTIVLTMSNFNNNTVPLILTGGGPGTATNVISLELYRMGFTYYKFGLASALSVLVFLVNIVFVVLYVRMIKYDV